MFAAFHNQSPLKTMVKQYTSSFDELSFFPRAGVLCLVKCDQGQFSSSLYLKFKGEVVVIGRGCLVLLKFKSFCVLKLCKDYVFLVLIFLVLIRHPSVLIVSD